MTIKVLDKVDNYLQAIKISCDLLKEQGIVEERYYYAILDKINEFGAYFCISEKICMPHARPEEGAIKEGLCILKLNQSVDFMGKDINVFFTLSAKDNTSHLNIIKKITEICIDTEKFNKILNSKSEKEILEVI